MTKIPVIFLFELRAAFSRRSFILITLSLPAVALLLVMIGLLISSLDDEEDDPKLVGYVDQWGELPTSLDEEIPVRVFQTEDDAREALLAEDIEVYYIVPDFYLNTGQVTRVVRSNVGIFEGGGVSSAMRSILIAALLEDHVDSLRMLRVNVPAVTETIKIDDEGNVAEDSSEFSRFVVPYVFSMMLLMSIGMTAGFLVQSVAEEKQTRTIEILLSSVSPSELMAGKILGLGTAGVFQIVVWVASAAILARVAGSLLPLPGDLSVSPSIIVLGIVFFLLGYLFYSALVIAIGAIATTPQEGGQIAGFITFAAAVPVIAITPILNAPDGGLARVMTLIPFTSPVTVMLRSSALALPLPDLILAAAILSAASFGIIFASARVFKAFLLSYGRRPSWREIWLTIRQPA